MNALILAAGQGKRLAPHTNDCPKCLLSLGDTTFIGYQIALLRHFGIKNIGVVTGFCADRVRLACGDSVRYFHNSRYDTTNSLYSFLQAAPLAGEGCLVLNSDVVLDPALLQKLLDSPHVNALLADFESALGEEEMKVVCDIDGRVREISKKIPSQKAQAENLGVLRLGTDAARAVLRKAQTAADSGLLNLWMPQGVAQVLEEQPFYAIPIAGKPWIEVDFLNDLQRAREVIYPLCRLNGAI